jgi:hypothetical protein
VYKRSLTGKNAERVDKRVLQVIYHSLDPGDLPVFVGQQMGVFVRAASHAGDARA